MIDALKNVFKERSKLLRVHFCLYANRALRAPSGIVHTIFFEDGTGMTSCGRDSKSHPMRNKMVLNSGSKCRIKITCLRCIQNQMSRMYRGGGMKTTERTEVF